MCWIPSDLGRGYHLPVSYIFAFSYCSWDSPHKNTGVGCHFLLQCAMFCQNSSLWPTHHGWPWMLWLIASLSYTCPFATTGLCSMKWRFSCTLISKWECLTILFQLSLSTYFCILLNLTHFLQVDTNEKTENNNYHALSPGPLLLLLSLWNSISHHWATPLEVSLLTITSLT